MTPRQNDVNPIQTGGLSPLARKLNNFKTVQNMTTKLGEFAKKFLGTCLSHRDVYINNNNNNNNNILLLGTGAHYKLLKLKHAHICK